MSDHEGDGFDLERWEEASLAESSAFSYAGNADGNNGRLFASTPGLFPPVVPPQLRISNGSQTNLQRDRPYVAQSTDQIVSQNGTQKGLFDRIQDGVLNGAPRPSQTRVQNGAEPGSIGAAQHATLSGPRNGVQTGLQNDGINATHAARLTPVRTPGGAVPRDPNAHGHRPPMSGRRPNGSPVHTSAMEERLKGGPPNGQVRNATWFKGAAVDGRAEHRQELESQTKQFALALKSANIKYPIEGGLLWSKTLDGNEFCRDNAAALDEIRLQFSCKIEFCQVPGEFSWMKICVTKKKHLVVVISRITNIVREYVSRSDQLVKMNLIRYPSFGMYREEVGLLDLDPKTKSYLPTLHGALHPNEEEWKCKQVAKHLANRRKIKSVLDRTLKSLAISQRHVRMRLVFGELGFIQFQKPPNGAPSYQFEDFYKMVTQGRTKLNLNNVAVRQGRIEDLSDVIDSLDAFICPEVTYGAYFDFAGGDHEPNSLIRLDCTFGTIGDGADHEIQEMRWLVINDVVGRLQLAMIDFERPDFQFTIDAFPLYENRKSIGERQAFQTNVSFKPHPQGLKAPPRMRVKVPPTTANLREVSEITTMRWCFKETDGVFELRRKDIYEYNTSKRAGILRRSTWHAVYYYPEWDNLMGQFGSVRPGQVVDWEKSIMTFFPEDEDASGLALPKGFKGFMAEVDEVQELLGDAIRQLAVNSRAAESSGANGTEQATEEDRASSS
ncbi:hypothetical protein LTR84_010615 [Exophiala bonariae]|uniref:DUF7905 domain-containing protein n=1 Tax=Exophiala bonariae TaxID=1690606 RepID=A0AAV9MSN1_9EURO|nr:hypothetical protein LTR84_010615 [Exophiala bonariae]